MKHGYSYTTTYKSWQHMKSRCLNPNDEKYKNYGGRGITFCERWNSFENFLADMGDKPRGLLLERKDNDGDYTPENCKWASNVEQANNRRPAMVRSTTGLVGVSFDRHSQAYRAYYCETGTYQRRFLYYGPNFFNACCARKSWEAKNALQQA